MRLYSAIFVTVFTALTIPMSAHADAPKLRGEFFCFPAEDAIRLINNLKEIKAERRDVVDATLNPIFLIKDGGDWPERFFFRGKTAEIDIPIEKPSGLTPTFMKQVYTYPKSDICIGDKTRADRRKYDEGLYFEIGLSPLFHNSSGHHEMMELEEGTKDGKQFYQKMLPAIARIFMPDTDYLAVRYDDLRVVGAEIFAQVGDKTIPLTTELYKEMHVVSLGALKKMGASGLIVKGGAYHLQPTVSVKTMKKFGWGQEDED